MGMMLYCVVWTVTICILVKFSYAEGKKAGYLEAVKDIIEKGKLKSVEEVYK
jgi:hypothetical protein